MKAKNNFKIFEGESLEKVWKKCLSEGYIPANIKTLKKYIDKGKIPKLWYDTSTGFLNYEIFDLTLKQINNIEKFHQKGGCLLFLSHSYRSSSLGSHNNLDSSGCIVGVKSKRKMKK